MALPKRYEPTGTILSGGRGDVQVYTDTFLNRSVAVKTVRHDSAELRSELATLRAVSSDHVVDIYDFVTTSSSAYLIEEFLSGPELNLLPTTAEAFTALLQISIGVADIHAHGLVHGDLKPANLRFNGSGLLKIFDFGFARTSGHSTVGGRGTIPFMSPELFTAGHLKIEPSADTYAFGVLGWLLFEGSLPDCAAASAIRPPTHHTARMANPDVAAEVKDVVDACLSYVAKDRPSMLEVSATVRREMNRDRHQGHLFYHGKPYQVAPSKGLRVKTSAHEATIRYDGLRFVCTPNSGVVKINGSPITQPQELPGCCLITLGDGRDALHVPFDLYEPGVL